MASTPEPKFTEPHDLDPRLKSQKYPNLHQGSSRHPEPRLTDAFNSLEAIEAPVDFVLQLDENSLSDKASRPPQVEPQITLTQQVPLNLQQITPSFSVETSSLNTVPTHARQSTESTAASKQAKISASQDFIPPESVTDQFPSTAASNESAATQTKTNMTGHSSVVASSEKTVPQIVFSFKIMSMVGFCLTLFLLSDALISLYSFQLRTIELRGIDKVTEQDLTASLNLEQLRPSLVNQKLDQIEKAVQAHPWVKSVEASFWKLQFWNSHITLDIVEHKATAVAVLDELMVVDHDGMPFAVASPVEVANLPLISGISSEFFNRSQKDKYIGQYWLSQGILLAKLIEKSGLTERRKLSDIHISTSGRYEIMLDQIRISLGLDMLQERIYEVEKILKQLEKQGVTAAYILLSDDLNRAIVKKIPITAEDTSP